MKQHGWSTILSIVFFAFNLWVVFSLGKLQCNDVEETRKCIIFKNMGHCVNETYETYMSLFCNKTCGLCDSTVNPCPDSYFSCLDGLPRCVPIMKMCDCKEDCANGHDETDCEAMFMNCEAGNVTEPVIDNFSEPTVQPTSQLDPEKVKGTNDTFVVIVVKETTSEPPIPGQANNGIDCPARQTACTANKQCMSIDFWCDGWINDCPDGEDELDLCYKSVNRDAFKMSSVSAFVSVTSFFVAIQKMKHAHCTMRTFSCRGACLDDVDLYSHKCACDAQCWMRQDCCHDVAEQCPDHAKPKGVIEQCSPNLFGKGEELSALVIDQCPDSATVHDTDRCNERDNPEQVWFYGAPVYSPDTDKHYRNYYCAKCNGAKTFDLVAWEVWLDCQSTEVDYDDDCDSLVYIPPVNHLPATCRVKKFQDPSFEPTVITTKQRDELAVKRCQEVYAPVKYNGTMYRNPYCVYLHRSQMNDRNMSSLFTCDFDEELPQCEEGTIPCRPSFSCLPKEKECDGVEDCADMSDEPESCKLSDDCYPNFQCKRTRHQCFSTTKVCDGSNDCDDHSDEENCPDDEEEVKIMYRNDFQNSLSSRLDDYPPFSNTYEEKTETDPEAITTVSAIRKKTPECIDPLDFDGVNCKYSGNINQEKYNEVYLKQDVYLHEYNITLTPLEYRRPLAMTDDPVTFLSRHLQHYPYQVVDFELSESKPGKPRKAQMSVRQFTKLEENRGAKKLNRQERFAENYLQIGTEVYHVTAKTVGYNVEGHKLNTLINCQFDSDGPIVQVVCTGCAHVEYTSREYVITTSGNIQLTESGQTLHYHEYELRSSGSILVCWDTPNSNVTVETTDNTDKWMKVWFGVGYSLALLVHLAAITMNLLYGRKTTLRIFFINFTTMGVLWSFDALLCTVSSVYSTSAQSLHLYGSLGTLAWLLIISFHLLLSVSDGSPAVYFSVDNLVYYHVCGWLCPLGWVLLFFLLSTFKVVENVVCLTDSRQGLVLNQSSEILHFPVWVLIVVIFFLLLIVIGTTKRLMSGKSGKIDVEVMSCRLQIKMMVFVLYLLQALPWIVSLCLKYIVEDFKYHNAVFCLCCVIEGFYLIYILKALVNGNLEKLRDMSATPDSIQKINPSPNSELSRTPEMKPALPPKTIRGPRPPLYQRPVDHNYTPFPDHHNRNGPRDSFREQDQYSHLQGGHLGGKRTGKKKDYYPMTQLGAGGSPAYGGSRKGSLPAQNHQYMPLVRSEKNGSPSAAVARTPPVVRSRQRTTSSQGITAISSEAAYQPLNGHSDKGKHRVPRSAHPSDQSNSLPSAGPELNDNPPPYRLSEGVFPEGQPCSSTDGRSPSNSNFNQVLPPSYKTSCSAASTMNTEFPLENAHEDALKSSYC